MEAFESRNGCSQNDGPGLVTDSTTAANRGTEMEP